MIDSIQIKPITISFNLKTRESCKNCKRYGFRATCPPHVEEVEYYHRVLRTYSYGTLYYAQTQIDDKNNWEKIGKETSLEIHNKLIEVRNNLFSENCFYVNIFGAGSCKLCKECSFPCRTPQLSIIPLEATGVNVVELMGEKTRS